MTRAYTSGQFERAVLDYYLDKGEAATIKDLASYTGYSEGALRRVLEFVRGSKVDWTEKHVARHSKSYPDIQVGGRMVTAFQPSRDAMAHTIKLLQHRCKELRDDIAKLEAKLEDREHDSNCRCSKCENLTYTRV